jgi:putative aldouronate transport system permease protein
VKLRTTAVDKAFDGVNIFLLLVLAFITLYPFLYVLSCSISDPMQVATRQVRLLPKGFSLTSYRMILSNPTVYVSYYNTLWYVVVGTLLNVALTMLAAYPLSRRSFFLGNPIMLFIVFTMFFSGGLIPTFLLVKNLGLYNTRWAIILASATNAWSIILARTFIRSTIPESLCESARIDGANDIRILWSIILPLCRPIIAVVTLFSAVTRWNSFFDALIYLSDPTLHPMQLFLRRVLLMASDELVGSGRSAGSRSALSEQLRFTVIMVTILPIICVYPLLQRHFVKGVMIGAVKG